MTPVLLLRRYGCQCRGLRRQMLPRLVVHRDQPLRCQGRIRSTTSTAVTACGSSSSSSSRIDKSRRTNWNRNWHTVMTTTRCWQHSCTTHGSSRRMASLGCRGGSMGMDIRLSSSCWTTTYRADSLRHHGERRGA